MKRINPKRIKELRALFDERVPILEVLGYLGVKMVRSGNTWVGKCLNPNHQDTRPSLTYMENGANFAYCFSCKFTCWPFHTYQFCTKKTVEEVINDLAAMIGLDLKPYEKEPTPEDEAISDIFRLNRAVAEWAHDNVQFFPDAFTYLTGRYTPDTIKKWKLGYSNSGKKLVNYLIKECKFSPLLLEQADISAFLFHDRIVYPITNIYGGVVGFSNRIWGVTPEAEVKKYEHEKQKPSKFVNTSAKSKVFEKSKCLYGLHVAREAIKQNNGTVIAVEGFSDVIAMHEAGFTNTIGLMSTTFNKYTYKVLAGIGVSRVIFCLDGDDPGRDATIRNMKVQYQAEDEEWCSPMSFHAVMMPPKTDPDKYFREGKKDEKIKALKKQVQKPMLLLDFYVSRAMESVAHLPSITDRVEFIRKMKATLAGIVPRAELKVTEKFLQENLGITARDLVLHDHIQEGGPSLVGEREILSVLAHDVEFRALVLQVLREEWFSPKGAVLFRMIWDLENDGASVSVENIVKKIERYGYTKLFVGEKEVEHFLAAQTEVSLDDVSNFREEYHKRKVKEILTDGLNSEGTALERLKAVKTNIQKLELQIK